MLEIQEDAQEQDERLVIKVLDHGFVRLVSFTQPATRHYAIRDHEVLGQLSNRDADLQKDWTGDLEVVRNARTSYNADHRAGTDSGSDDRLIARMTKHHHTTPFESMSFTFEVMAPIFVIRQWHRSRTWAYNEVSARYSELPEVFYVPDPAKVGVQHASDKQMRVIDESTQDDELAWTNITFTREVTKLAKAAFAVYKIALKMGVPRELARIVLPFNTYTRMFATVNYHNLKHFLGLRLDEHAQYEIRVYAEALSKLVEPIVPVSHKKFLAKLALEWNARKE